MKTSFTVAVLALLLLPRAPAEAKDVRTFYRWVEEVVTDISFDGTSNVIAIKVKDSFLGDDISETFRTYLPGFIICTKFADELEKRPFLEAEARAPGRPDFKVSTTMPGQRNTCDWYLNLIDERIQAVK